MAGGEIFVAAATDDLIRAIDLKTGKVLWKDVLSAGGQAMPTTASNTSSSSRAAVISWKRRSAIR
jgi:glucose dehydrogenase